VPFRHPLNIHDVSEFNDHPYRADITTTRAPMALA
jgi:hypothetical protein